MELLVWTVSWFPLTQLMVRAAAGVTLSWGWHLGTTAILTGFSGRLRVMVLLYISSGHVSASMSTTSIVLELPDTETSARGTVTEKAMLTFLSVSLLLLTLCESKS